MCSGEQDKTFLNHGVAFSQKFAEEHEPFTAQIWKSVVIAVARDVVLIVIGGERIS